jgi:hypothetical protein
VYGWKGVVANVSDVLHRLEIAEIASTKRYGRYFADPIAVFKPAVESRQELVDKYIASSHNLRNLTNILYQKIREPRGIAPGIWHFSKLTAVDSPLLWKENLDIASKIPPDKRYNKHIIFETLDTFPEIRDVPFSDGGSWDNTLEFYFTGIWEELLDYLKCYCPWPLDYQKLRYDYLRPPIFSFSKRKSLKKHIKEQILQTYYGRKIVFSYLPHLAGSSIGERLVIRLAMLSHLCETLTLKRQPILSVQSLSS